MRCVIRGKGEQQPSSHGLPTRQSFRDTASWEQGSAPNIIARTQSQQSIRRKPLRSLAVAYRNSMAPITTFY